jgi:hypothetical protein
MTHNPTTGITMDCNLAEILDRIMRVELKRDAFFFKRSPFVRWIVLQWIEDWLQTDAPQEEKDLVLEQLAEYKRTNPTDSAFLQRMVA